MSDVFSFDNNSSTIILISLMSLLGTHYEQSFRRAFTCMNDIFSTFHLAEYG